MPHVARLQVPATAKLWSRWCLVRLTTFAVVAAGVLGVSGNAIAHHSFAMFDQTQTVTVQGTVKELQWTNPHVWIELMVDTPAGSKQYSIEAFNVRVLRNAGWKYDTLNAGDKISVVMNPLRNGASGGSLVSVKLADGRIMKGF